MDQQFSLRWNNYLNQITEAFGSLKNEEDLVDVTLSCEGKKLKAHKMLLSACSPYFRDIFKENPCQHPVIVFRNFKFVDLEAIIDFMYKGEVDIKQEHFESFLGTAELLEVKGLAEGSGKGNHFEEDDSNASKMIGTGSELQPDEPNVMSFMSRNQPDPHAISPDISSNPPLKKRKSSSSHTDKGKPSEKKQKSTDSHTSIIPKIEKEEFIEDLTFDEEDTDDSRSTNTELSVPTTRVQQDLSELAKGLVHLPEPGSSLESLPPEIMQTQEIDISAEEIECTTEIEVITKEEGGTKTAEGDQSDPTVKSHSSGPDEKTLKTTSNPKDSKPVANDKPENKNESSKDPNQNLKDVAETAIEKPSKSKALNLPKGLTVTMKETKSADSDTNQNMEDQITLRSEEAKTPIQEEPFSNQGHVNEMYSDETTTAGQLILEEPEMAEEAPQMASDEFVSEVPEEEQVQEIEPEFDYFGCEVCKSDAKPVDTFNLALTHKCPICPCVCFCSHLLKEHMKIMHGWFNVQRRYKHY